MTDKPGSWLELMRPHIRRFELAAALGLEATYNAAGSGAMASLITKMATIIDNEIERRQHEEHDHGKTRTEGKAWRNRPEDDWSQPRKAGTERNR